jgi:hypothetical protein
VRSVLPKLRNLLSALAGALVIACGESPAPEPTRAASAAGPDLSAPAETVVGFAGPGGGAFSVTQRSAGVASAWHRAIGRRTFELSMRPAPNSQQPCTSCHVGASVSRTAAQDAHQDIPTTHPFEARGSCAVCHARADVARLVLQSGESATLDQSYRLCAQCHSMEAEAWAGGGHGKRLVGWRGPRVVMGCADCHDPHAPSTPRRIPFAGPVLP